MNIFIAGSSQRRHEIAELYKQLREAGHTGYDWTQDPGWDDPSRFNPTLSALADLEAVRECDALIWYLDAAPSHGAPFEAGFAYAKNKPVVVFAKDLATDVFRNLIYAYNLSNANTFVRALEFAAAAVSRYREVV